MDVEDFIRTWTNASASERQTAQSFVIQLCRVLGVAAPNDEKVGDPDYPRLHLHCSVSVS